MTEPITAFYGKNGSGKSLCMVERIILPALAEGRTVLSNMVIFDSPADAHLPSAERLVHPLWQPLTCPADLIELHDTTVAVDEIQSAFSSRESTKMPAQTVNDLLQLRKDNNALAFTAPSWKRADITIREVVLEVVLCTGHFPKRVDGNVWASNRLFRYRFYNGEDFEEFNLASAKSDQAGTIEPAYSKWYRRSKHQAHLMYDTHQHVGTFSHLDDFGHCTTCGGTRKRPACACPPRTATEAAQSSRSGDGADPASDGRVRAF